MSKSEKIRRFVKDNPGATKAQIAEGTKLDRAFVDAVCRQRVAAGEFILDDGGYTWNVDFVRGKHGQRLPKKVVGNRAALRQRKKRKAAAPRIKSMKALADKVCPPAITPLTHLQTTWEALNAVLNLDGAEPMLVLAYQSHREAVAMAAAIG